MEKIRTTNRLPNPRNQANFLSVLTFGYVLPTFVKGFRKDLEEDDIPEHLNEHASEKLGDRLERAWMKELTLQKPSLWRAIAREFGLEYLLFGFISLFNQLVLSISQPIALSRLIKYYTQTEQQISETEAYVCAGIIVGASFFKVFVEHNYMLSLQHYGMKLRVASCSLIYRKSLRLSNAVLGGTTVGQLVNLLSNDVNRFNRAIIHGHILWICPLEVVIIIFFLYNILGLISTIGIFVMVLFVPFQMYLAKKTSVFRLKSALKTDERIRLMNEIITGVKVIKMYAWEKPFAKLIGAVRRLEMRNIRGTFYIRSVMMSIILFITRFSIFLTVLTYVLLRNDLQAEYIFVLTSFYNILKLAMIKQFSGAIVQLAEINVSISRIQKFLLYEEVDVKSDIRKLSLDINGAIIKTFGDIDLQNVTAKWSSSSADYTLDGINLAAHQGDLIAIVGPVGSGKTSLFHVILKELPVQFGVLNIRGTVSYASQEPWVFSGSIQQNIIFGQPMDMKRYQEIIRVCVLEQDIALFPYGDKTLVGERGVLLSGGQKARVSLARAIYRKADIYLLDDPLSAVDTHVGKELFENCILKFLKNKCTLLVTHQLQYLKSVSRIIIIESGKITANGTYQMLRQSGIEFAKQLVETKDELQSNTTKKLTKTSKPRSSAKSGEPVEAKEHRSFGTVSDDVYISYFKSGGSLLIALGVFIVFVLTQALASGADYFLTYWVNMEQAKCEFNNTNSSENGFMDLTRDTYMYVYSGIVAIMIILTLTGTFSFYNYCTKTSIKLHDNMFSNIIYAPMRFFNTNSSGRILNRFAKDIGGIDEVIPTEILICMEILIHVVAVTILVSIVKPWTLMVIVVLVIVFYIIRIIYLRTSRSVKRLEGITRSPVFGYITTSLQGLTTIRAYGVQRILEKEFDDLQDTHSSVWYLFLTCTRAFGFWLDLIWVVYIATVTFSFFITKSKNFAGNVGLAITQAMSLTGRFQVGMRQWSELENQMTSVERVLEYTTIEREPEHNKIILSPKWPVEGRVRFLSVSLKYLSTDPYVLKQVKFDIKAKEKVGIVGRTGAGKSSLVYALFQLTETEGAILIDDIDITKVPYETLRSRITIIPQEPILFSGSLRKNLDPFEEYSDVDLWNALDDVDLKVVVSDFPAGLNAKVSEGGSNFSVGQRQLICLARAIIRKNKILVLDEATANVDPQTDTLIQKAIRKKFGDCTVLTIAHRLHTIMDSDKVLVMEAGKSVEFDHPYLLLQNTRSLFYFMVQQTGYAMAETLMKIAKDNFDARCQ